TGQHAVRLTPVATPPPPPPPTLPAAPSRLTAKLLSASQGRLRGIDNATNETRFRIQRAVGAQGFVLLARVGADRTEYVDTTVVAHGSYRYRVRAENGAGVSSWSNTVTAVVP